MPTPTDGSSPAPTDGFAGAQPIDADAGPYMPALQRRIASASSARSADSTRSRHSRIPRQSVTKENAPTFAPAPRPRTPDARTMIAGAAAHEFDPDRSAELSPVAQRMMADLRARKPARAEGAMAEFVLPLPR